MTERKLSVFLDLKNKPSSEDIEARNPKAWRDVRMWSPKDSNVFIWGEHGSGKTFMARQCLHIADAYGYSTHGGSALEVLSARRDYLLDTDRCGALMLDDIDKIEGRMIPALYSILDYRHDRKLATVITSNYDLPELMELFRLLHPNQSFGRAIGERITPALVMHLEGDSLRGNIKSWGSEK